MYHIHMGMLSDEEREFIGFFWADGSMMIQRINSPRSGKKYYRPRMSITQREDGSDVLEWCKRRFGGKIYRRDKVYASLKKKGYIANPRKIWEVLGFAPCRKVAMVLVKGALPAKKKKELPTFVEFLKTAPGSGHAVTDSLRKRQESLRKKLSSLKQYSM
ncbi:MAG: hypothetical protein PHQ43_02720 [Dehalococcoidales bacterium]|nr:hypothetical protein [Dehalococcoidales bacterium]